MRSTPFKVRVLFTFVLLSGCASTPSGEALRIASLPSAEAILLGEQHDAPTHQTLHRDVIRALAAQGRLAAVVIEMAERGTSTAVLKRTAGEEQVQSALRWNEAGWPWLAYGPAIMAAVRAGVPVMGANLPRSAQRDAMVNLSLDGQLPGPALKAQQQAIRVGHCQLLPESQIQPMTRIQLARDQAMAKTIVEARVPGKVVVLLAGAGHVDATLGVPQHLPAGFDAVPVTLPRSDAPAKDHCADLARTLARPASGSAPPRAPAP